MNTHETNMRYVHDALIEGCAILGLQQDIQIVEMKDRGRIMLSYTQKPEYPNFGHAMIRLERWMKERLQTELELQLESTDDRSKRDAKSGRLSQE